LLHACINQIKKHSKKHELLALFDIDLNPNLTHKKYQKKSKNSFQHTPEAASNPQLRHCEGIFEGFQPIFKQAIGN